MTSLAVSVCLALLVTADSVFSAKFPSNIKGCKRDDPKIDECVIKTINHIVPFVVDGCKECGIPLMDPFEVKSVILSKKDDKGMGLDFKLEPIFLRGLTNFVLSNNSKFSLKERKFEFKVPLPYAILEGKYKMDGKLLLLPIKGEGKANITFENLTILYDAEFAIKKAKDGKEHLHLVTSKMDYIVKHMTIQLENLFNGDKKLGEQMNIFLNQNWKEVLAEFGPAIRETVKTIITLVLNNVARTVPYDVLLPK